MIYDFIELKDYVKNNFGVDPDSVNSKFKPIIEKLTKAQLDKSVDINSDGIFYIDKKGNRHKGFLYIESGYSQRTIAQTGTRLPKFHVLNCQTINEQKQRKNFDGHYVFSTEAITMEDIDGIIKELTLCGNCHKIHSATLRGMTTSDFRELFILNESVEGEFFESELPKDISTDFWGYTPDWYETSRNYRMKKKFTCEDCGINLNQNLANGYYLETHHIDGNTKNNDEDNFKCLCVLCHASVDKYHKENYNKGAAKQKLLDFIKLFEDELIEVGNKYLRDYKKFY
jgi:hypothetical protein